MAVEEVVKEIQSRYGEGSLMRLGGMRKVDIETVSTGSFALDMALGVGGIPRGRVIEVFGPESSGKTTLALHVIANAQRKGGVCAFIDAEHALDPEYAKRIGVRTENLLISQPDSGEQALEIAESLVRTGGIALVVIDSVAALTPRAEIEGDMGQQHMGLQARLMSHALRKLTAAISRTNTTVIFTNQIRMKIGTAAMYGNPETTPGGNALKFYASVRIEIRRAAKILKGEEVIGSRTKAKVVKNKVAPPFRTAEFDIMYNHGISYEGDIITLGAKCGLVKKSGASYAYGDVKLGVGMEHAKSFLKENKKTADEIIREIKKQVVEL
ncbi:MAG: recombinase RecA [Candidatus Ryanbacteria bacterium RIFCSPHIGHO2_02_FULL_45_17b]|uniref:Protein RecA n=1 Tax=Candidatus Ryanbacteria bacterium RIFCSPHIGHO2_01_FULL_45_22 TaxID=1802114 RepID=A0A1G2G3V3_9BACT|nr:MAG: recombinase RecA [Candidatus Ryanbacteria bacterium RIFCSPHIGHO2_01_FULL_45_22]OGZ47667.1 MAG: recombinase RecA [Candidatus Ryanbacteria bacterium RIFCSPHIGHO2_02_FULL_45_17b]